MRVVTNLLNDAHILGGADRKAEVNPTPTPICKGDTPECKHLATISPVAMYSSIYVGTGSPPPSPPAACCRLSCRLPLPLAAAATRQSDRHSLTAIPVCFPVATKVALFLLTRSSNLSEVTLVKLHSCDSLVETHVDYLC